uniref:Ycf20 n=1 Tax=Codium arabicum TaxID=221038 RepID=A0A386B0M3_CODAR|nr:hypothetical protein Ycf20 [Codium arabicum]AYC65248.1 hypothetical protein Ycf20 [Codium arabicum]
MYFFAGFLIGNLFGSVINLLRNIILWDGIFLLVSLLFFELFYRFRKKVNLLNIRFFTFQSGLLISFFIDAYKVGS